MSVPGNPSAAALCAPSRAAAITEGPMARLLALRDRAVSSSRTTISARVAASATRRSPSTCTLRSSRAAAAAPRARTITPPAMAAPVMNLRCSEAAARPRMGDDKDKSDTAADWLNFHHDRFCYAHLRRRDVERTNWVRSCSRGSEVAVALERTQVQLARPRERNASVLLADDVPLPERRRFARRQSLRVH